MKKKWLIFILFLVTACLFAWQFVLPIPTGYAAKYLCSAIFVAGMQETYVHENDLNFSLVKLTSNTVDYQEKKVRSTFLGLKPHVAGFRNDQCGCTLLNQNPQMGTLMVPGNVKMSDHWDTTHLFDANDQRPLSVHILEQMGDVLREEFLTITTGTRAIIVLYDGEIVAEEYAHPFHENSLFLGWSMAKSIIGSLVGVLVQRGLITIQDPVPISIWSADERKAITWENLLQMNSGLAWNETYYWISDVTKMLYTRGDTYHYAIHSPLKSQPGNKWVYSSGTSNIISGLIRNLLNDDSLYHQLPYVHLFYPIGAQSFVMELDVSGNFIGSSYAYATARDWARFGLLYLNQGKWGDKQILPTWWTSFVTSPASGSEGGYGGHFWLNQNSSLPSVPDDLFYADGFQGQRVFILPSKNLVVVRFGLSIDEAPDYNQLLAKIIAVIDQ